MAETALTAPHGTKSDPGRTRRVAAAATTTLISFGHDGRDGAGMHFPCLEIQALHEEFSSRLTSIELAGEPRFDRAHRVGGPKSSPARYTF